MANVSAQEPRSLGEALSQLVLLGAVCWGGRQWCSLGAITTAAECLAVIAQGAQCRAGKRTRTPKTPEPSASLPICRLLAAPCSDMDLALLGAQCKKRGQS